MRWEWWRLVLLAACAFTAGARPLLPTHGLSWPGTYEACAHLLVGGLIGAYLADRQRRVDCLLLAVLLAVVELLCFLWGTL